MQLNKNNKCKTNMMCKTVYCDLINSKMDRDVQEVCANELSLVNVMKLGLC